MKYLAFFMLIVLFFPLGFSNAQAPLNETSLEVTISPENPGPNTLVSISVNGYIFDIDSSLITWTLDGVNKVSKKGEKNFSFVTKNNGNTSTIRVSVSTTDGRGTQKTIRITPSEIDLVWESESYTPPFYKGKGVFSYQNKVTFIALPHILSGGSEISPSNLTYKWKNNGSVIQAASGYGKNTYSLVGSVIPRTLEIEVEVYGGTDGQLKGVAKTFLTPIDPLVLIYEKNPIYGINFQKALLGNEILTTNEISVIGIPYFFGIIDPKYPDLVNKWYINGKFIGNDQNENEQVFRKEGSGSGTSKISLNIENSQKMLQMADIDFNLSFNTPINNSEI